MKNMVKLNHLVFRKLVAIHGLTQEKVAEEMDISIRHVRNLCKRDTNPAVSVCAAASELFKVPIESLLIRRPVEE